MCFCAPPPSPFPPLFFSVVLMAQSFAIKHDKDNPFRKGSAFLSLSLSPFLPRLSARNSAPKTIQSLVNCRKKKKRNTKEKWLRQRLHLQKCTVRRIRDFKRLSLFGPVEASIRHRCHSFDYTHNSCLHITSYLFILYLCTRTFHIFVDRYDWIIGEEKKNPTPHYPGIPTREN